MEENKITNEEIIVTEEEKVVEVPKAEEPAVEETSTEETALPLKKSLSPTMISRSSRMTW